MSHLRFSRAAVDEPEGRPEAVSRGAPREARAVRSRPNVHPTPRAAGSRPNVLGWARLHREPARTYSLDLSTLLTVPLHLALFSADRPAEELMGDGVTLLEALRRTAERVTVFCEGSRTKVPEVPHTLFPLLERVVVEARSWDLVLTLEGEPGARAHEGNRPLARLLARLPELALRPPVPERARRVRELADLALHTGWEPPAPVHAKAYLLKRGWRTHVVVGSANATRAALGGRTWSSWPSSKG